MPYFLADYFGTTNTVQFKNPSHKANYCSIVFKIVLGPRTEEQSNKCAVKVKVKVKIILEQATKAQRGSTGIDVLFI